MLPESFASWSFMKFSFAARRNPAASKPAEKPAAAAPKAAEKPAAAAPKPAAKPQPKPAPQPAQPAVRPAAPAAAEASKDEVAALRAEVKALREDLNHAVGAPPAGENPKRAALTQELAEEQKKLAAIQAAVDGGLEPGLGSREPLVDRAGQRSEIPLAGEPVQLPSVGRADLPRPLEVCERGVALVDGLELERCPLPGQVQVLLVLGIEAQVARGGRGLVGDGPGFAKQRDSRLRL